MPMQGETEHSEQQIKRLLIGIQNLTTQMNNTFEQAILKHEEQFIKTYRIKISQLTKLFEDLTRVLEEKFISNALANRLNIVIKERDYFKYQCLKLNIQYQTALTEQNGLAEQVCNVTDQMKIYKRLLQDEKIKIKELEKNADKFKINFNDMAYRTLNQSIENLDNKIISDHRAQDKKNKKLQLVQNELQQKNEQIRNLKIKMSELELIVNEKQMKYFEKKELSDTFKACVGSWKRHVLTKERKNVGVLWGEGKNAWNVEKITAASKKELLLQLFTSDQFLKFIEKLLFDPNFKIEFTEVTPESEKYMIQNRLKLFQYMRKKRIVCSPFLIQR